MDVIIVCHTEFGFVKDKRLIFQKKGKEGVTRGVTNLVAKAEKYGAKVTFALMPETAPVFPKDTGHEVGLHVHPGWEVFRAAGYEWNVGDSYLKETSVQTNRSTNLSDHPYEEQREMIQKGKARVQEFMGVEPKVFVAGRWALNNDTIRALIENGFTHDCSAIPHAKANYDWSRLPRIAMPYRPSEEDYQKEGSLPFLIVPVSQGLFGIPAELESVRRSGFSWLKACFLEYRAQKAPVFHLALHSPAMTDPFYVKSMDTFLAFVSQHPEVKFRFASEITRDYQKKVAPNFFPYAMALNPTLLKSALGKFARTIS